MDTNTARPTICALALSLTIALLALPMAAAAPVDDALSGANDGSCNNYGVQQQVSVTGNNQNCVYQNCFGEEAGAGAVGVGVGSGLGEGKADASASAGTDCNQTQGQTTTHLAS